MAVATETVVVGSREETAHHIIKKNMWWSGGLGLIPLPVVDLAAVTVVQLKMLNELCHLYNVPFRKDLGKNLLGALVGGMIPAYNSFGVATLVKLVPVVGPIAGAVTMPALSGASTYAIGKVFVQHFESGGTLLTFNAQKMKEYFQDQFKEGERLTADQKKKPA